MKLNQSNPKSIKSPRAISCVATLSVFFFQSTNKVLLWQILNAMTHMAEIRAPEPQNNSKNNGTNFTRGHMGQIKVIRCFVQNFFMVAYVSKAGLGPEPEFALLCRSFFRWSRLVLRRHAYLPCLYCWPTRVAKCYPAGPSRASLNLDKVFEDAKILVAVFKICIIFFRNSHRKDDWVKKSSKPTEKQESRKIRHMQFSHIKTSNWRLSGKWVKNGPICRKSQKKFEK